MMKVHQTYYDNHFMMHIGQIIILYTFSSVQFSCSITSDSLRPRGLQYTRLPCLSPTLGACSNSWPLNRWCHPTISSSVVLLLLPSVFPRIRVSSNESVLRIRWPKYWSFSFLTCIQISPEAGQVVWYFHLFKNFPQFVVIHTVKGFGVVNKAEIHVFLERSCFFDIQRMLAIWSLVPLPFLNLVWTCGSSRFTNCWSLAWRILYTLNLHNSVCQFYLNKNRSLLKKAIQLHLSITYYKLRFKCILISNKMQIKKTSVAIESEKWKSLSCVQLFATPWTVVHQASCSVGFSSKHTGVVTFLFPRGSSRPKDWTHVSWIACRIFSIWATKEAQYCC